MLTFTQTVDTLSTFKSHLEAVARSVAAIFISRWATIYTEVDMLLWVN